MHWAVHRHTAVKLIVERPGAEKEHMGLTIWEAATQGKIVKADVSGAKNYLNDKEMSYMERIVSMYFDYAELQAKARQNNIIICRVQFWGSLERVRGCCLIRE